MHKDNLLRMSVHVATINPKVFDMECYRISHKNLTDIECNSVGCAIGHSIILAPELVKFNSIDKTINFEKWAEDFTGINILTIQWSWCFSPYWSQLDDTPTKCAKRIKYIALNGNIPKEFRRFKDFLFWDNYQFAIWKNDNTDFIIDLFSTLETFYQSIEL